MIKKNLWKIVVSSVVILLPILLGLVMWNDLPDTLTTHWGLDGNADGFRSKVFAVIGLPCILLFAHLFCLFMTAFDKKQKEQNSKALGIIFWILPSISLFTNGIMYRAAFGAKFDFTLLMPILFGFTFIFIGNYLPKIKQNRTLGIKIFWTLNNEENWNKTHRFGGKTWVVGGLLLLLAVFLPHKAMLCFVLCVTVAMVIIPVVYSFTVYRRHKKEGVAYKVIPKSKADKIAIIVSAIIVTVILIGTAIIMFTGSIEVICHDSALIISADYWTDAKIDYLEIDTVEYRKDFDVGVRTNGFMSAKLSMGIFENDEFGAYTLYAYNSAEEYIVLTSDGKTLVIGMDDIAGTQSIYDTLTDKIDK